MLLAACILKRDDYQVVGPKIRVLGIAFPSSSFYKCHVVHLFHLRCVDVVCVWVTVEGKDGDVEVQLRLPVPLRGIFSGDCKSASIWAGVEGVCPLCTTPYNLVAFDLYRSYDTEKITAPGGRTAVFGGGSRTAAGGVLLFRGSRRALCLLAASSMVDSDFTASIRQGDGKRPQCEVLLTRAEGMLVDPGFANTLPEMFRTVCKAFEAFTLP